MELRLGKMTSKEIAEWFGITYGTLRNKMDKYCEVLTMYADFDKVYGGFQIKEIFIKEYDKKLNVNNDLMFIKEIMQCNEGLASITGMARKFEKDFDIKECSIRRQLTASRDRLFGKSQGLSPSKGVMGMREYVWAIKVSDMNEYRSFTAEENELFDALIRKVYGNVEPERAKGAAMLEKMFKDSDMSKEEYFYLKETNGFDFFQEVVNKFKDVTGQVVTHATKYEINKNQFDLSKEDEEYRDMLLKEISKLKS